MIKRIFKSTGLYSISVFAGKAVGFVLLPVYTRYLTPADYGVIELLELTLYVFQVLIGMKVGEALLYHHANAGSKAAEDKVATSSIFTAVILAAVAATLGELLAPMFSRLVFQSDRYILLFRIVFLGMAVSLPTEVCFSYLRALDRAGVYAVASVAGLIIAATFNIVSLTVLSGGVKGLLWSRVASAVLLLLGLALYCLRGKKIAFDYRLAIRFLKYSAPLGIGGLGFLIIHYGDRFFLQRHATLTEVGYYSLAYRLGMLIVYLQTPFSIYWSAQRFRLVRGAQGERIIVAVCTYLMLGLTFAVVLFAFFSEPLVRIMASPAYLPAAKYVPWVALAYLIEVIGDHFRNVFLIEGRTGPEATIIWMGAAACLAGYVLLIPRYRAAGAVGATLLAFSVMFVLSFIWAQRFHKYPYEYRRMGLIVGVAGFLVMLSRLLPSSPWIAMPACAGLALLFPVLLVLFRFPTDAERAWLARQAVRLGLVWAVAPVPAE
jgi:O-antigen/teichoic acid export membrane protein